MNSESDVVSKKIDAAMTNGNIVKSLRDREEAHEIYKHKLKEYIEEIEKSIPEAKMKNENLTVRHSEWKTFRMNTESEVICRNIGPEAKTKSKKYNGLTSMTNGRIMKSWHAKKEAHDNYIKEVEKSISEAKMENGITTLAENFTVRRSNRKTSRHIMAEKTWNLENAVREQREDGLKVVQFEGKGRGVLATRPFQRGEFVMEYSGELISAVEARQREARYALDPTVGCYMYYFRHGDKQYCIDATAESGRLGRLVNHSRSGNLATKVLSMDRPRLVMLAAHDISPGDELTYDYGDRSKKSLRYHPWLAL